MLAQFNGLGQQGVMMPGLISTAGTAGAFLGAGMNPLALQQQCQAAMFGLAQTPLAVQQSFSGFLGGMPAFNSHKCFTAF